MKLGRSLYGLAQSPGNWFHTIDPVLILIGFVPLMSDTCIYIYDHDGIIIILTLYVDDLLVIGGDPIDREDQEEADGPVQDD